MCIFDFLDILLGKDAKNDKQNAIPFTDGEEECDNCGDYIEDCECDCDDVAHFQKKHGNGLFLPFLS